MGNYEGLWVAPSVKIYSGGGDVYIAVAHTIAGYQAAAFRASSLIWSGTGRITASVSHTATSGTSRGIELADTTWVSAATSSPAISITARVSNGSHAIYQSSGESFTLTSLASAGGGISVSAFTPVTTNTALFWYGFDVLSRTGEISVFSNGVSNWNSTQARDFGAATGTDVLSSSATISIQVEDFLDATANNQSAISTSSRVQIRPNGSNFASTDTQLYFRIDAGSVILGNSSNLNSSTVTWNSRRGIRSNGPIEIYGNRFALREQSDLQTTGLAARVLVRLKDGMYVDAGSSDSDAGQSRIWTNRGDLILWADTDGDGSGGIVMESFTDLNTANGVESTSSSSLGGRILLGGGSSVGADGYPTGNAGTATWGYTNRSIHTGQNVDIYSGGGDIRILGRSNSSYGVVMYFGTDIVSGVGTVELRAETTGSGTGFYLDEAVNNVPFNIISYASSSPAIS
ncbi:MAG: hypothetical protein EBS38_08565, partial [Actinobacteria bacterium]|nr:hypothetical protein [Actinomycetota bacterium]